MVAFRLWTTASRSWLAAGVLSVLGAELAIIHCSVTFTIVAFLCTVTCLGFGSMDSLLGGVGEGDWLDWEEWLVSEPGKLADLHTFLEEMVMEEKLALFWGMIVVTAELCDSGAVALTGWTLLVLCKGVYDLYVSVLFVPWNRVCGLQGSAEVVRWRERLRGSMLVVFIRGDFLLRSELVPVEGSLDWLPPGKDDTLLVFQPLLRACQPKGLSPSLAVKFCFSGTYSVWIKEILCDKYP